MVQINNETYELAFGAIRLTSYIKSRAKKKFLGTKVVPRVRLVLYG